MADDRSLELPEHVVLKIQKVLGISPTSLLEHNLVSLIEELCDPALRFDREERGVEQTAKENPPPETAAAPTTRPVRDPLGCGASWGLTPARSILDQPPAMALVAQFGRGRKGVPRRSG